MQHRTLLYLMNSASPEHEIEEILDAGHAQNARIICLLLDTAPAFPPSAYAGLPYAPMPTAEWTQAFEETRNALAEKARSLAEVLARSSVAGSVETALTQSPDLYAEVSRRAMQADLVSVAENLRENEPDVFRIAAHATLMSSPAPLVLNCMPLAGAERVFVGWNGSLPAARAIRVALPILREAKEVILAVFDPHHSDGENPGSDMAEWLSHHGCTVTVNQYPSGGELVGEAMRKRATETGSDLVVMGAYGRSRMRELVFGGSTRTMLAQTRVPVLMAH